MRRREFITLLGGVLLAGGALLATASFAQGIGGVFGKRGWFGSVG